MKYNYYFYLAIQDYVLRDKKGELGAFLGCPMYSSRPYADLEL